MGRDKVPGGESVLCWNITSVVNLLQPILAFVLSWMSLNLLDMKCNIISEVQIFQLAHSSPCKLFHITLSNTKRNRNPDIPQPCFTPLSILTQSDCSPLFVTHISLFLYNFLITVDIFGGIPYNSMIFHNVSLCAAKGFLEVDEIEVQRCLPFNTLLNDVA